MEGRKKKKRKEKTRKRQRHREDFIECFDAAELFARGVQ